MKKAVLSVFSLFIAAACSPAAIESKNISDAKDAVEHDGITSVTYFLPRQRAKITVSSSPVDNEAVQKSLNAAIKAQQNLAKNPKDALFKDAADLALKEYQQTKKDNESGKCSQSAKFELLEIERDPEHHYIAYFKHSIGRDDVIDLQIKDGFLSGAETTLTDRSLDIVLEIAKAVGAAIGVMKGDVHVTERECPSFARSIIIDPTIPEAAGKIEKVLKGTDLHIEINKPGKSGHQSKLHAAEKKARYPGLMYRQKLPYVVTICKKENGQCGIERQEAHYNLPDATSVIVMPVEAGRFVSTKHKLLFDKGVPTQVKIEQNSELLAIASFPLSVAKAILSVPAEILQIKIDHVSKEKELVEAQKGLIEAQRALLKARENSAQ